MAALLLGHGANLDHQDAEGKTPLGVAAAYGHAEMVALLLDHDASLEHQDISRMTCLCIAAERGHLETVNFLVHRGGQYRTSAQGWMDSTTFCRL
jgi:ankyrin repeat protein